MCVPSEYPDHDFNNGLGLRCIPMLISTMGWGCVVSRCWFSAEQAQQPRNDNKNLRSSFLQVLSTLAFDAHQSTCRGARDLLVVKVSAFCDPWRSKKRQKVENYKNLKKSDKN